MIEGAHVIIYSRDAKADREFLGNALGSLGGGAGEGWLIFALPPAEVAVHPTEGHSGYEFYLTCDDIERTLADLSARGVKTPGPVSDKDGASFPPSGCRAVPSSSFTSRVIPLPTAFVAHWCAGWRDFSPCNYRRR